MNSLRGRGHGRSAVLARAAILSEDERGRPTLDAELLALAVQRKRRAEDDLDVILVAEDPLYALLLRLPPGLALAGVAAERELMDPPIFDVPVISGLIGLREAIDEGEWLILDPARGRLVVGPDAEDIAHLQADRRPRVLLGAEHLPARTQGGQEVAVWARVSVLEDVEEALTAGADGLCIDAGEELLPLRPLLPEEIAPVPVGKPTEDGEEIEPPELPRALLHTLEMAGNGDTLLLAPPDVVDPRALVSLAGRCRLRWCFSPEELPGSVFRLRALLERRVRDEEAAYRPAALPRICALLGSVPEGEEPDAALDGYDEAALFPFADDELAALTLTAVLPLPPLRVAVTGGDLADDDPLPTLRYAVAAGVRGVLVPPRLVSIAKECIRGME